MPRSPTSPPSITARRLSALRWRTGTSTRPPRRLPADRLVTDGDYALTFSPDLGYVGLSRRIDAPEPEIRPPMTPPCPSGVRGGIAGRGVRMGRRGSCRMRSRRSPRPGGCRCDPAAGGRAATHRRPRRPLERTPAPAHATPARPPPGSSPNSATASWPKRKRRRRRSGRSGRRPGICPPPANPAPPRSDRRAGSVCHDTRTPRAMLAGAYPFLAEGGLGSQGVFIGQDLYSGGSFVYDPWVLYANGIITAPNIVVAGIVGSGKVLPREIPLHPLAGVRTTRLHPRRPERRTHGGRGGGRGSGDQARPRPPDPVEPAR